VFKNKNLLLLHLIVFIWGWAPIMGKLISVQAISLVWYRLLITIIAVGGYMLFTRQNLKVSRPDFFKLVVIGAVIAFHWVCFYNALKISNVSVTMVAFATGTLFTSVIEPLVYKRKIIRYELVFGMVIIAAIAMIFTIETRYAWGIFFGIMAAFTASLFTVFNGLFVRRIPSTVITIYELSGGFVALSIYLLITGEFNQEFFIVSISDWVWLFILSIACTAFPFIAIVNLLKKISPYTITLTINLETIYGIIFAYFIWKKEEAMTPGFYLGTLIILATIFGNSLFKQYLKKQE
jgi:drug/metabolite transporter (DMT)-like permease